MTTGGKDTASFFENGTTEQFDFCYKLYPEVLKLKAEKRCKKPQELIRLDEWYQNELPKLIKARGKDAHMVYDELVQTMKWKQSRGKFYPQLSYLVKVNTPRAVMQETKKAFRKLPNLEQAITALSNLKGVGTTMASALLAAAAPDSAPFMADECLMAIPEIEGIDYTTKEYLNFVQHIQTTVQRLNTEHAISNGNVVAAAINNVSVGEETPPPPPPFWSPHRVELALWSHYVANDLSPDMLEEMPVRGLIGGVNTNGSVKTVVKVLDGAVGGDDTNDDDGSLGVPQVENAVITNNTATESETENENTNPAPSLSLNAGSVAGVLQDGDSNFVSNDSTSQGPIIDENTTQTTATTTSTDDGEVGTPLASDSEQSNLEAPPPPPPTSSSTSTNLANAAAIATPIVSNSSNSTINANTITTTTNINTITTNTTTTNNNNNKASNVDAQVAVGNGNGSLVVSGSGEVVVESLDGKNNSCPLRSAQPNEVAASEDDEVEEDDDEDDEDDDDNDEDNDDDAENAKAECIVDGPHAVENKSLSIPLIKDGSNTTTTTNKTDVALGNDNGQKRALHCGEGNIECAEEPELKKIKSDD